MAVIARRVIIQFRLGYAINLVNTDQMSCGFNRNSFRHSRSQMSVQWWPGLTGRERKKENGVEWSLKCNGTSAQFGSFIV